NEAAAASSDYLRMFALVAMGYMWARMAKIATEKLAEGSLERSPFYTGKIKTARFFFEKMLPETEGRFRMIMAGAGPLMTMEKEEFAA
nr:acyl-CoA dehydrogenase C-terminal domain-containing protein [Alphaproteobacteria bacterium]